ncbi:ribokinase [Paenarthrobacter sp. Z7-10]|uniref:ribokinase n=1 Tax=Paenarthrobacter sp. Z7-10 TaxID=2787635 RepID=UPI0022A9B80F|nr:ribokinase [Paenarthrobacter sp. Z7-10]MCZ2403649.1 ribokinase [Paenarthrobacter sp. Z7-10]
MNKPAVVSPVSGQVVVVGSINVDQVVRVNRHPRPGETLIGTSMVLLPGGKGANQAVAAARLGAAVALVGAVGSDGRADDATALLLDAGVDLTAVQRVPGPSGLALITVADDGENTIVVLPGANAAVVGESVTRSAGVIAGAAVLVLQGEIPAAGIAAAARLATGRLVLNLAPVIELETAVILRADPLVVNEHEAALVLSALRAETKPSSAGVELAGVELADVELVAGLRACGVPSVVLTRGALGAICADDAGTQEMPAPTVIAVDTSGAGDAFVGALSARLAVGDTLAAAVRLAVRVGAFAVLSEGTQPSYPMLNDELPAVHT